MKALLITFLLISFSSFAQEGKLILNKAIHFELATKNDTIDFLVIDTILTETKPIFLFCQGSQPVPLIIDFEDGSSFLFGGVSNFDVEKIKEDYHLVAISMPETPLRAKKSELNQSYAYITNPDDKNSYKESYLKADYLENYVNRATIVLSYLQKKSWVSKEQLVIAGHSQGSKVAVKLASENKNVTHLGLFGFNAFGRIEQMLRQERKYAETGVKTWGEAEEDIAYWEQLWKDANNEDSVKVNPNLIAWKSFSQPLINELIRVEVPVYICYGTEDMVATNCDILPLMFTSKGKDNLTLIRKHSLNHNFFELAENGRADHKKPHWVEVMNEFVEWTKK
ncbi:MAG: hypothetical protein COA33_004600 [Fluviicola sp.]|nr:hypothetical protein [Fluviicola sp.]